MNSHRIEKLQNTLGKEEIDAALLLYHRDVYYYAGTARPASLAVVPDDAALFVRRGMDWARSESSVRDVREGGLTPITDWLDQKGIHTGKVGIEMDVVPADVYLRLRELLTDVQFVDISPLILGQRLIKDEKEIEAIRGACKMVEQTHRHLPHLVKEGMTELELAAELEAIARKNGHESFAILRKGMETGMGFALVLGGDSTKIIGGYGQVVTGEGLSSAFPYGPSERKIKRGTTIVFDIAGLCQGYHSDLARTYCLGKPTARMVEAFSALVSIQSVILDTAKPGASAKHVYEAALKKAKDLEWGEWFQGPEKQKGTFVGHGLGLEIDEPPLLSPKDKTVIRENMTFTTELFIVHPEFGEVKLEDTVLIAKDGPVFLTGLERNIIEV
jgi:Xaa-Pro aminopeptidase